MAPPLLVLMALYCPWRSRCSAPPASPVLISPADRADCLPFACLHAPPARRYTSKVTLQCPTAVHSRVDDSTLFSHLTNKWEFRWGGERGRVAAG